MATATATTSAAPSYLTAGMGDGGSGFDDDGVGDDWWAFPTAIVIKWTIIGVLFLGLLVLFGGGHLHAKRRMKQGKSPLRYHKFMVPQRQLMAFYAAHSDLPESQAYFQRHQQLQSAFAPPYRAGHSSSAEAGLYPMGSYIGPPPPAYVPDDRAPAYTPREDGNNKVNPNQNYHGTPSATAATEGQTTGSEGPTSEAGRS